MVSKSWNTSPSLAPDYLYPWLTNTGSMTTRLIQQFSTLNVLVLKSGLQRIHPDEASLIALTTQRLAYTREVLLCAQQQPLLYAHTVTHPQWLKTCFASLPRQHNKPLGSTLFIHPHLTRSPIAITRIALRHRLYRKIQHFIPFTEPFLWARRSIFSMGCAKLMVTEVFLPHFVLAIKAR